MVITPKCLDIIKAQGYWGWCVVELSKTLLDVKNQSSVFLHGFVNSRLTALCTMKDLSPFSIRKYLQWKNMNPKCNQWGLGSIDWNL